MNYFAFFVLVAIFGSALANPVSNHTVKLSKHYNYYWRQYLGEIPPDAIVGGNDANGKPTYIGQAYYTDRQLRSYCALIPVTIHEGIPTVDIPIFGLRENVSTNIKILCGPEKQYFQWYATDSKHIFNQLTHKHIIPGGTEDYGITYIGRLSFGKEVKIGKVDYFKGIGNAKIYFADEHSEMASDVYQVLIFEDENLN